MISSPSVPNTSVEDNHLLEWVARDSTGNLTEKSINVSVGNPPVITINPPNPYNIPLEGTYEEFGAYALSGTDEINVIISPPDNLST